MPDHEENRVIWSLLRQGYGVEDVALMRGVSADDIREMIAVCREQNTIFHILGTDRQRNSEALAIMGRGNA